MGTQDFNFGEVIRRVRLDHQVTQAEVARGAGLSHNAVARIEFGQRQPTLATALAISSFLAERTGVSVLQVDPGLAVSHGK